MNGQGMARNGHPKIRPKLGRRDLWTLALAAWVCACALVFAVTRVTGGRDAIQGSGSRITEERLVGHFEHVSLRDLGTLIISQGAKEALTVETDDNLMRYIQSRVQGGTLVLSLSDGAKGRGVEPSKGITYRLSVRHIAGLEVADSGCIQAQALDAGHLEIRVLDSGDVAVDSLMAHTLQVYLEDSGHVYLTGRVERQEITAQDSGRYLAGRLQSQMATVATSDSAEATLWATESLNVTVTDSGRLRYYGDPRCMQRLSDNGTLVGLGEP